MSAPNPYCEVLGIQVPRLDAAINQPDANYYSLLIVALLEHGRPMTLAQVAQRFEEAGVASAQAALASLKRCKPGRAPIYRDGDLYALDPHNDETDLWAFRLGLRPAKAASFPRPKPPEQHPLPAVDAPLQVPHLDEAWKTDIPNNWSAQRIAICVLDVHGRAMDPDSVVAFVSARSNSSRRLSKDSARYWHHGAIQTLEDGRWELDCGHPATASARKAVRQRIEINRRWSHIRPDPAAMEANRKRLEQERKEHAAQLAAMRRVIVHAFPADRPQAVVLLDVDGRNITTLLHEETGRVTDLLCNYDIIAAVNVHTLLRHLGFDHGRRMLVDLGPPQKTMRINRQGRTLKLTLDLLVRGTCSISRPFGDAKKLRAYLQRQETGKLVRRLESDAKSLYAFYQYGRLHRRVRVRWGFVDEMIPAPWRHVDEPGLYNLMEQAHEKDMPLDVIAGTAPGWADPWARAKQVYALKNPDEWWFWLADELGEYIDECDVQLARLHTAG